MSEIIKAHLADLAATDRLARALASLIERGDTVLLSGDLGAGKTTLVRALAASLGIDTRQVSSPTFTVMNEYAGGTIDPIIHMDAYRLEGSGEEELLELGWDHARRAESAALIEWGERIAGVLATTLERAPLTIELAHAEDGGRSATLVFPDDWAERSAWTVSREIFDALREGAHDPDRLPPGYPFGSAREQMVDLYHWFGEAYRVSRPIEQADFDE